MTASLTGYLMSASEQPSAIYKIGLTSVRFLLAVGDLIIGWRLLVQAEVAHAALTAGAAPSGTRPSIRARSPPRRSSPSHMLPTITTARGIVEAIDLDIMELPEAAF